jgi:hypothetical protein
MRLLRFQGLIENREKFFKDIWLEKLNNFEI